MVTSGKQQDTWSPLISNFLFLKPYIPLLHLQKAQKKNILAGREVQCHNEQWEGEEHGRGVCWGLSLPNPYQPTPCRLLVSLEEGGTLLLMQSHFYFLPTGLGTGGCRQGCSLPHSSQDPAGFHAMPRQLLGTANHRFSFCFFK